MEDTVPTLINRLLRTPWGFPLVIAVAVAGIAANEVSHERTLAGLRDSQATDEVMRQASVAHYNALDRVNALRAYLLEPQDRWLARFRDADGLMNNAVAEIVRHLQQQPGPSSQAMSDRLTAALARRSADLARGFDHARAGRRSEALTALRDSDAAGHGTALRTALQQAVDLAQADRTLADARLLAAMQALRWLVHALIAAMLLAAWQLLRQAQQIDAGRQAQADELARQVAARTAELRELAGHLMTTREDERAHLARELHDEMGGLLSATKLDMARLKRHPGLAANTLDLLATVDRRVTEVVGLTRQVIERLRPSALDHLGLPQALQLLCDENAAAMEVPTHADLADVRLPDALQLTLYRIAQEALTNARKYSRARTLWVTLRADATQVQLTVEDNGVGFNTATVGPGHHGLAGMRLRVESHAGQLSIGPRHPGPGARVHAVLPVPGSTAGAEAGSPA